MSGSEPVELQRRRRRRRGWLVGAVLIFGVGIGLLVASRPRASGGALRCERPAIVVRKSAAVVELWCGGRLTEQHLATFGAQPKGPKLRRGDERTPEGEYRVSARVVTARFHRFLGIDYPNAADRARGRAAGIADVGALGSGIGIHGVSVDKAGLARVWLRLGNTLGLMSLWGPTDGCIGVTNESIEALYSVVQVGTPVRIVP